MTTLPLAGVREWFAEDLRVTCNFTSEALVRAFADVPRERFLGPGPWQFVGGDIKPRTTPSDDPRHVYHNISIALDPARNLYNGQPGVVGSWIDATAVAPGERVVHIGCGTGYFTAVMAHVVGSDGARGEVLGIDVDPALADRAAANLAPWPWARAIAGDGRSHLPSDRDVLIVNAGATHILDEWLDALRDGGRLVVPFTAEMPGMMSSIGKGFALLARRTGDTWSARVLSMIAIYSFVGGRDRAMEAQLGQAFMGGRMAMVKRLRRDPHEAGPSCWLHGATVCVSTDQ